MEDKPDAAFAGVPGLQQPPSFDFNDPKPQWPEPEAVKCQDEEIRRRQKKDFDRRHAATVLPPLEPGDTVWVRDIKETACVLSPASKPRSYVVKTPIAVLVRNRVHQVPYSDPTTSQLNEPASGEESEGREEQATVTDATRTATPQVSNEGGVRVTSKSGSVKASFGVAAYLTPPENTCKGIIRGVDVEVSEAQRRARIVNHRNPGTLEARRVKNTTAVVVLFEGMTVPNYVSCDASIFHCTLYRRHTEVCYEFGELGHRADVCPNPGSKCDKRSPTDDHQCYPKCPLCGGPHPTAAKACRDKFEVPYIVRRRRRQRRRRTEQLTVLQQSRDSTNFSTAGGNSRSSTPALRERSTERSRSRTPAARKRDAKRTALDPAGARCPA
ncbi:hypothetical protein MTO96_045769 [Rhipicephalus appendiculatus]